jgi:hypothetical protein
MLDLPGGIREVEFVVVHLQFPAVRSVPFSDPHGMIERPIERAGVGRIHDPSSMNPGCSPPGFVRFLTEILLSLE